MELEKLKDEPRLLLKVGLKPMQGTRFQPTGFPDLGPATYQTSDGTQMLLVESAQSMANRMEEVCWDEAREEPVAPLKGMPYVESILPDGSKTNSLLEAHRLNSPYLYYSDEFSKIREEIGFEKDKPFNKFRLVKTLLKYDPNSIIHGVFLTKVGGSVRICRMLSGFIEAENITVAPSGGTKIDRVQPGTEKGETATQYGKADEGYGNIPFHRDEFTGEITAYFNLDLALLSGYGFSSEVEDFLISLSLYKIRKFLNEGLRLRTACDLEMDGDIVVKRPEGFTLPSLEDLESRLKDLIEKIDEFADPPKTEVRYNKESSKKKK